MIKIGVLSDTHIPFKKIFLPSEIFQLFSDVDLILHAGDICKLKVIDNLESLAPVIAVGGNMDPPEIFRKYGSFNLKEIAGKKIFLIHGNQGWGSALQNAKKHISKADCVVFGHSHSPYNKKHGDTILFNPGSSVDFRRPNVKKKEPSVGIITIKDEQILPEIIYL